MQGEVRRRRSALRSKIVYKPENSPSHFKRPAYYLKQLRDSSDFRLCDIELVTDNGCENVHSAIAAAHCTKIAKLLEFRDVPLRIDVRGFHPESVRRLVEWMYTGHIAISAERMEDQMSVTNYFGTIFLHHLLENTLKSMAVQQSSRIEALNIATHPKTGVSSETITCILRELHEKHLTLSSDEIKSLKPWAVRMLVLASVSTQIKIALINTALSWLRYSHNIRHLELITSSITIDDMNIRELSAFQRTLRALLLNPSTRKLVTVSVDKSGVIAINMDRDKHLRDAEMVLEKVDADGITSTSNATSLAGANFTPIILHEKSRQLSSSKCSARDLPSYSQPSTPRRSTPEYKDADDSLSDSNEWPISATDTLAQELANLPPTDRVFGSNAQQPALETSARSEGNNARPVRLEGDGIPKPGGLYLLKPTHIFGEYAKMATPALSPRHPSNRERRSQYSQSELDELRNYPDDIFNKTSVQTRTSDAVNQSRSVTNSQRLEVQAMKTKELAKRKEDTAITAVGPTLLPAAESGPKYIMSHYAF
ncbi:unnamed protein product [Cylicocyclus nassatus]|uniref:BTB domain-containing protein n=1 Tax=Cylicocyclus nassatus TaxID=53992 RepID=A0AA36H4Y8_CYLNA|nr:unnamed protein product [Cylicocyclus nassatus]